MKKLVGYFAAAALVVGIAGVASAEGDGPDFTFGASTSYVYDINGPNNGAAGTSGFNSLAYANQEPRDQSFNVDLIQLGISGQRGAASYGATLDFGDLAYLADNSSDAQVALQTAWLGYDMDMVGFTAGRFGTPIGYEVLEPWGNANISRSYGWQIQPINHDGVTAHATLDMFEVMAGAVNNFTVAQNPVPANGTPAVNDTDNRKGVIWAISGSFSDALNGHFSGIYTDDFGHSTVLFETNSIIHGKLEPGGVGLRYAIEYTYLDNDPDQSAGGGSTKSHDVTANIGTDLGPTAIDFRFDYLNDDGNITPVSTKVYSSTLTLAWALVEGMDFRVEYRHDEADDSIYGDGSNTKKHDNIVQAQLVWYPEL
jgi:hypothetical protein